jgi:hypothetical protein
MQIMGLAKLPAYKSITIWISLALIFQVFCFWKTEADNFSAEFP